ncbi:MAG: 50S ribosomal protein L13 [Patescibacteria group bacterium]
MSIQEKAKQNKKAYEIDAAGKPIGRLASLVAGLLLGKDSASYEKHWPMEREIKIKNIGKVKFTGRKLNQKVYYHHTGYLGHLKETKMKTIFEKDPGELFRKVLRGMLPKNKWRDKLLKRIKFVND